MSELKQQPEFNMEKALIFNKKHEVRADQEMMKNLTTYARKTNQSNLLKTDNGLARLVYNFQKDYCASTDGMAGVETKEALKLWSAGELDKEGKKIKVSFTQFSEDRVKGIIPVKVAPRSVTPKVEVAQIKPVEKQIITGRTMTLNGNYKLETLDGGQINLRADGLEVPPTPTYSGFINELKKGIQKGTVTVKGMNKENAIKLITDEYNVALQNRERKGTFESL